MLKIRKANRKDAKALYGLIIELAQHHNQIDALKTDLSTLIESGFSDSQSPQFEAVIAESNEVVVGYITYTYNYSIWSGSKYIHIDDVFVSKPHRGLQIGLKMMTFIKNICKQSKIEIVKWELGSNNHRAADFYKKLGAQLQNKIIAKWEIE